MRPRVPLSIFLVTLFGCERNYCEVDRSMPPIVDKAMITFGIDGLNHQEFTYNDKGQVIHILDKDRSIGLQRPDLFTSIERTQSVGLITKVVKRLPQTFDTAVSVVRYRGETGLIDHVITTTNSSRDSSHFTFNGTNAHVDLYSWNPGTSQYSHQHRTYYERKLTNIQSAKRYNSTSTNPTWTKTYEYDLKDFPFAATFQETILLDIYEGQVGNNMTRKELSYKDANGNLQTEVTTYSHTYNEGDRPVKTVIRSGPIREIQYIYR